jgi:hypothetical protein
MGQQKEREATEAKELQPLPKNRVGFTSVSSVSSCLKDLSLRPLWPTIEYPEVR